MSGPRLGPYPVILPKLGDPRLVQSAVLLSVQVLGQTVLGFALTVPQILVSLATGAVMELSVTFYRRRIIMWPASALLTGNGVALLLRHPGTGPDQPWSFRGLGLFAGVAALSMLSKYLIRWRGRHLFNPSNAGLLVALVVLGSSRADIQALYWGRWRPSLAGAVALIVVGAVVVTRRAGVSRIAVAYLAGLGAGLAVLGSSEHCIAASWHPVPLCDWELWWRVMSSPETLIFAAFMVTDPKTTPSGPGAQIGFGAFTGLGSVLLAAPGHTEFGTKVALLGSLALACALLAVARALPVTAQSRASGFLPNWRTTTGHGGWWLLGVGTSSGGIACALILLAGLPARSVTLAADEPTTLDPGDPADPADLDPAPPARAPSRPPTRAEPDARRTPLPPWPAGIEAPSIVIEPAVAAWAPWFGKADADARSRALVRDLEARRRRAGDAEPGYVEVVVLMVREPGSAQAAPEIGFRLRRRQPDGTERTDLFRLASRGSTFVVAGDAEAWPG